MADEVDVDDESVWYRLGYTMEKARARGAKGEDAPRPPRSGPLRSPAERQVAASVEAETDPPDRTLLQGESPTGEPWEAVLAAAAAALAGRLLDGLPRKRRPGVFSLARAGIAGAGAALLRELLRPVITGTPRDEPLAQAAKGVALAGAARGLLYGGLVEPRIPGPPLVRGAAYGLIEHLVSPWGGLTEIAGARAPHRNIPFLADLFEDFEASDDTLVDHLVFGIALAALYGIWARDEEDSEDGDEEETD